MRVHLLSYVQQGRHNMRKQRTIQVNDERITIVSTTKTNVGNPNGFMVRIKSSKDPKWLKPFEQYCNYLERNKAEDFAYAKWVQMAR